LMTGMGQGGRPTDDAAPAGIPGDDPAAQEWDGLVLSWIPWGGVEPARYQALQARFIASLGPRPVARSPRVVFRPTPDADERREPSSRRRSR